MKVAALIFDESSHYLDHLAPYCALQGWPLLVCEEAIALLAKKYYPDVETLEIPWHQITLPSTIVSCYPHSMLQAAFPTGKLNTLWLPHGNSDKGWKSPLIEGLKTEPSLLVYGQKMVDFITEKGLPLSSFQIQRVGNFRLQYAQRHARFYQEILQKTFLLPSAERTFLYAPTWKDTENNSSFWEAFPILAQALPEAYNLLVKLHPNTTRTHAPEIERLIGRYQNKKNIVWVTEFPPIYPLLQICDAYIGDMSSIGYDFLAFNRPMYFLNSQKRDPCIDKGLYLYQCGLEIQPENYVNLFQIDKETRESDLPQFSALREKIYTYTFS